MARILVVDDDPAVRSFARDALQSDGHVLDEASDLVGAKTALSKCFYDGVIASLDAKASDGLQVLQHTKAEQPYAEVVVLAAHVDAALRAMKEGAVDFLEKPLHSTSALRAVVQRALERRALLACRDRENRYAKRALLVTQAPAMRAVVETLQKAAHSSAPLLLLGEIGTGKEACARAVHGWSARSRHPFVSVNCAAYTDSLLEGELFGHERGALAGAESARRGRIELAVGGTLFLDEIGEMKPSLQVKLLRVMSEGRYERLGGTRSLDADVRFIASSSRDLGALRADGRFRDDLHQRLATFAVRVPPLRERKEDLPVLVRTLLEDIGAEIGRPGLHIDDEAVAHLAARPWPANVRELRNALERAALISGGPMLRAHDLEAPSAAFSEILSLEELERKAIARALVVSSGNRRRTAELLGIGLRTLYDKLKRYELS